MVADSACFILDMHQVDGISESAARLLNDMRLRFAKDNIAVVFSRIHGRTAIKHSLSTTSPTTDRGYLSFEDNDLPSNGARTACWVIQHRQQRARLRWPIVRCSRACRQNCWSKSSGWLP